MAQIVHVQTERSQLFTVDGYLSQETADALLEHALTLPLAVEPTGMLFGKTVTFRRCIGFFADDVKTYSYTGQTTTNNPLTEPLRQVMAMVNASLGMSEACAYNGVLVNMYRDGTEVIGAHSDRETEGATVTAISLGASRKFRIRRKTGGPFQDIPTKHGQLLVMNGDFQNEFTHEIPKETKVKDMRVSLTFRHHR